ncbi:tetratricopeptide repeat protein, partial [Candidatus Poribacteria bacterium]|nr:tetratricopeptide repeat protein [Candidatus Poribacteria bacterium]
MNALINLLTKSLITVFLLFFVFDFVLAQNCYQKAELFGEKHYHLFRNPVDIDVYQDMVYLLDEGNDMVFKFDKKGELMNSFSVGPARTFAIAPDGFIYIGAVNREIRKYNENGMLILKWGGKGRENGLFMTVSDVFIDYLGFIYVNDSGDCHIQTFSKEGDFLKRIGFVPFKGGAVCIHGLLVDRKCNYYGRDPSNLRIIKISPKGEVLDEWGYEGLPLCLGNNNHLYAAQNNQLTKLSLDGAIICQWGSEGEEIGQFKSPTSAAISDNGVLYVLDAGNKRIQAFYFPDEEVAEENSQDSFQKEETYLTKAISLYSDGKLRSAIQELKATIQSQPKNSAAYYYLGLCYTKKEKYVLALQAFEQALELNRNLDDAYYQIGLIAETQEDKEKALEYYEKCTLCNGKHSLAHYKAGLILFEKENYDRSRRELEAAFWHPETLDSLSLYNVSMILGRSEAQTLKKPLGSDYIDMDNLHDYFLAKKYRPYSGFAYNEILDFYRLFFMSEIVLDEKLNKSEKYLTKAIRANPKSPEGYLELGKMYYNYFLLTN